MNESPDEVCERFSEKAPGLSIRVLDEDLILIESGKAGFQFLADLFSSMARGDDDGFQIGPRMAGAALFAPSSQRGLYLHRKESADD